MLTVVVTDDDDNDRELPVYLHTGNAGILLLRHACVACAAELKFNAGLVSADDFAGHDVVVKSGIEKRPMAARAVCAAREEGCGQREPGRRPHS